MSKGPTPISFDSVPVPVTPPPKKAANSGGGPTAISFAPDSASAQPTAPVREAKPAHKEPSALAFPYSHPPAPAPATSAGPRPIDFPASAPTPPGPSSLSQGPRDRAAPSPPPSLPHPLSQGAQNFPPPLPGSRASTPVAAFGHKKTDLELKAIEWAKANMSALYDTDGHHIDRGIEQLLPFTLGVVSQWGVSATARQASIMESVSLLARDVTTLGVLPLTQEVLNAQIQTPSTGVLQRAGGLIQSLARGKKPPSPADYRLRVSGLRAPLMALQERVEDARAALKNEGRRIPVLLTALSAAAQVAGECSDNTLAMAIDNRRRLLQSASTQHVVLADQLNEMRRQIVDQQSKIEHVLHVTLPALENARAMAPRP